MLNQDRLWNAPEPLARFVGKFLSRHLSQEFRPLSVSITSAHDCGDEKFAASRESLTSLKK
jgi:hypothetical protein